MEISRIAHPTHGTPMVVCGQERYTWKQGEHRGICCSLEWVRELFHRRNPPRYLCMWRAASPLVVARNDTGERGIYAIGFRAIGSYLKFDRDGKCTGGFAVDMLAECQAGLATMGFDPNDKQALIALVDCIIKYGPDLARMPKAPRSVIKGLAGPAMFDMTATDKNTGKVLSEGAA